MSERLETPGLLVTIATIEAANGIQEVKERVRGTSITLITPPSPFLSDERVFPFLGVLKVAAELERNGNPVDVLDLSGYSNYLNIIEDYCVQNEVLNFGLTATTPQIPNAVEIANKIKNIRPAANVILGGPHVTLTHTAYQIDNALGLMRRGSHAFSQLRSNFDQLVVGDGEMAIFEALDSHEPIIDAGNRKSSLFMQRGTLDDYADPARHLIDLESYKYYIPDDRERFRAVSIIGQLGCPFKCGFCGGRNVDFLRLTRTRSVANIINELETLTKESSNWQEPIRGAMFYDDELNVHGGTLEELCTGLIDMQARLGAEMRFRGFVKAELFNSNQAELMYKAGFRVLLTGVESGSDKILTSMQKNTSREVNSQCVNTAHNAGLNVKALMSIGHPGETVDTVGESVKWVKKNLREGDDVDWTIITEYPGSPYFDQSDFDPETGAWVYVAPNGEKLFSSEVDYVHEANFYKGVPGEYTAYVWTEALNPRQLIELRDQAEIEGRRTLGLPDINIVQSEQFEHSMGQGLPGRIFRSTTN
ncbi:hypothetical protein A2803_03960 [Candidatus Woesebacteria bacterium RIFCSPHIGHO2_01_FULL_44_21]|uniref:Uncharacterized protein n=1 Tax=Candidatus Woesebacteria bacterium RIFCSPHIGHO2_01_FULL_44_21 TaxID=1802503 RepID=A0A1F7YVR6_9BACT|nr:MAG: hypothetical protein A2803_03960 [Candidatus Woesebacteria bacterium RIFCSPHIGHO2_01_FULL_44_21]